jgi:quaternary ammonium compound-resistance protein SugE
MTGGTAWLLLVLVGLLDVAWAATLKLSAGFARPGWSIASLLLLGALVLALARAVTGLSIATAYAAWTGIGAVGTVAAGILFFGESLDPMRLLGIAAVVAGVVLLKLAPA